MCIENVDFQISQFCQLFHIKIAAIFVLHRKVMMQEVDESLIYFRIFNSIIVTRVKIFDKSIRHCII